MARWTNPKKKVCNNKLLGGFFNFSWRKQSTLRTHRSWTDGRRGMSFLLKCRTSSPRQLWYSRRDCRIHRWPATPAWTLACVKNCRVDHCTWSADGRNTNLSVWLIFQFSTVRCWNVYFKRKMEHITKRHLNWKPSTVSTSLSTLGFTGCQVNGQMLTNLEPKCSLTRPLHFFFWMIPR
jgi:hypothetical protein